MATRKPPVRSKKPKTRAKPEWRRVARPDSIDFRERRYMPGVAVAPPPTLYPAEPLAVRHQRETNACTGFALALVVGHLRRRQGHAQAVSPFMPYSMARRYDEFAGSARDEGSSLRGALKGWFKHGACRTELFPSLQMPPAPASPQDDRWLDAVLRPLACAAPGRVRPPRDTAARARADRPLRAVLGDRPRRGGRPHVRPLPALAAVPRQRGLRGPARHAHPRHGARARLAELPRTVAHWAPGRSSNATTHGGFDEDEATIKQVLRFIRGS